MPDRGSDHDGAGPGLELSPARAAALLGVVPDATAQEIRAAYLRAVAANPPDRAPQQFEQIRDAYRLLSDEGRRHEQVLRGPDPSASLTALLEGVAPSRAFVGLGPWLDVLGQRDHGGTVERRSGNGSSERAKA